MVDLQLVKSIYPFNKLEHKDFNKVVNLFKICSYRNGKFLYYQGDRADSLHFILKGKVSLYKWVDSEKERFIREVSIGNWLACSEALLKESYYFDAKAEDNVISLNIPIGSLNQLLADDTINISILNSIANWNRFYNTLLVKKTCLLALEEFIIESDNDIIDITQDHLSIKLGYTRESINKNLKKLECSGLIKLERSKIIKVKI